MNFKVSARLMLHLGEALISDELVALMELIKNSYDADANFANIKIDTDSINEYGAGYIEVIDNGCGMNMHTVEHAFLKLATNYKIKAAKFSPKFKRLSLGNKGIGRLALQRLGSYAKIITKTKDEDAIEFFIDWKSFSDPEIEIVDIPIDVSYDPNANDLFDSGQGTIIKVFGIEDINFWTDNQTANKFEREMLSIINPYGDDDSKFSINLDLNGESFSSEKYDINYLSKLADTIVEFSFEERTSKLMINVKRNKKYIDYRFELFKKDFDEQLNIKRNEKADFYFDLSDSVTIDFNNNVNSQSSILKKVNLLKNSDNLYYLPGDFSGKFFAFDKSAGRFDSKEKKALEIMNGVKLFRNNFRIVPYGDNKNDWLSLTKYSQQVKGNIFRLHTVSGFVYVDGESNLEKLNEMTNRQGLIDDNYGKNFISIMSDIIARYAIQSDIDCRERFNLSMSELEKMSINQVYELRKKTIFIQKKEQFVKEIKKDVDELTKDTERSILDNSEVASFKDKVSEKIIEISSKAEKALKQVEQYRVLYETEKERLDSYKAIVGASIVTESLAHEILGISKKIRSYISSIKSEIAKIEFSKDVIDMFFDLVISSIGYLERYASVLDTNSYTKRKKYERVDIREFTTQILSSFPIFYTGLDSELQYSISGNGFFYEIIKANFKIAIENLIVNSQYWTKDYVETPTINFLVDNDNKEVIVWDNGPGIDERFEKNLFDQYITGKPDEEGRGMGLYIAKSLLEELSASIRLLEERNEQNRLFKFCIKFD